MEERCIDHDDLFRVSVDKIVNELIDPGIDDGFMPGQEGLIGKEQASKGSPVDFASVQGQGNAPRLRKGPEFGEDRRCYVAQGLMGDEVGIQYEKALARKNFACRVFPRAHGAGKPDNREAGFRRDPDFQWKSPQLGPDSTLTRKGTVSAMTASISALRSSRTRETSASGASRMSSSCT